MDAKFGLARLNKRRGRSVFRTYGDAAGDLVFTNARGAAFGRATDTRRAKIGALPTSNCFQTASNGRRMIVASRS
jgi:hypothetical protein